MAGRRTRGTLGTLGLTCWALACVAACGARSELEAPERGRGRGGARGAGERSCLPTCTIGHQCCLGGCAGPAVLTESACCECLDGEVASSACPGATCGGGPACKTHLDGPCESADECCSGYCEYPSADAPYKLCLPI